MPPLRSVRAFPVVNGPRVDDHRLPPGAAEYTPVIVGIPVKDEAERVGACLRALAGQQGAALTEILLLVNNTGDGTVAEARRVGQGMMVPIRIVEHRFAPSEANAGHARRMAMELAAERAGPAGVLLTTDADGCVAPDWLAANLRHLRTGADAVAGRAMIDPVEAAAIPEALHAADARECALAALLDEITALLDPEPHDPWPRHVEHSGASICVTAEAYRRASGIPLVPIGEDRAFFAALRRAGLRVRHALDVQVTVSGRVLGRAAGGMADTIRRRMVAPDALLDDAIEPVEAAARRARLRGRLRTAHAAGHAEGALGRLLRRDLQLDTDCVERLARRPTFGEAWAEAEARSPALTRIVVPVARLEQEMAAALALRDALRNFQAGPADESVVAFG